MSAVRKLSYAVTEIRGAIRSLLLVTKDPGQALALATECRSRSGPFYRIEVTDSKGRLVLDRDLIDAMDHRAGIRRPAL